MLMKMRPNTILLITLFCVLPTSLAQRNALKTIQKTVFKIHDYLAETGKFQCPSFSLNCRGFNNVIVGPITTGDFNQCGRDCLANVLCQYWTWIPKSSFSAMNCFLLSSCNNPRFVPGAVSGPVGCV